MSTIRRDGPERIGSSQPKPLEERFTHCQLCACELTPERRPGGVCAPCMRAKMAAAKVDAAASSKREGRDRKRGGASLAFGKGRRLR